MVVRDVDVYVCFNILRDCGAACIRWRALWTRIYGAPNKGVVLC